MKRARLLKRRAGFGRTPPCSVSTASRRLLVIASSGRQSSRAPYARALLLRCGPRFGACHAHAAAGGRRVGGRRARARSSRCGSHSTNRYAPCPNRPTHSASRAASPLSTPLYATICLSAHSPVSMSSRTGKARASVCSESSRPVAFPTLVSAAHVRAARAVHRRACRVRWSCAAMCDDARAHSGKLRVR